MSDPTLKHSDGFSPLDPSAAVLGSAPAVGQGTDSDKLPLPLELDPAMQSERRPWLRRRFGSASGLLLALLFFPLPWVELQCATNSSSPTARALARQKQVPGWLSQRLLDLGEQRQTVFWQSGLQAALGDFSQPPRKPSQDEDIRENKELMRRFHAAMHPSPWLVLLPVVLLVGVVVAVRRNPVPQREWFLFLAACSSFALLVGPMARGFPVEQALVEVIAQDMRENNRPQDEDTGFRTKYTLWFGAALFAVFGAVLLSGADCVALVRGQRKASPYLSVKS
jgi:hypothetical protein